MCSPSPPAPLDYQAAAKEQGVQNIEAAKQSNHNVISPYGTQQYYSTTNDPTAYKSQLEKTIADAQAAIPQWQGGDQSWRVQFNTGPNGSERAAQWFTDTTNQKQAAVKQAQDALAQFQKTGLVPQDTSRPTLMQTFSPQEQALYDQSNKIKQLLGGLGQQGAESLQGVVGKPVDFSGAPQTGSYEDTRKSVIDAMMGRTNEDYGKQLEQTNANLIAAGVRPGTKAYGDQRFMLDRARNDARQQAEVAGGNAASQAYGVDEARRRQAITELLAQRQVPINEISALMSGSQVSNPFQVPGYNGQPVAAAPTFAATNALSGYNTDLFNQQAATAGNQQSGLVGLGGTALMAGAML
jgi:hypothetical protein